MIKIKNVDPRSAVRRVSIPVTSISSCDTQRIMVPYAGSIDSLLFHCTAAVVAGMHWVISKLDGTTLLEYSQTLTTVASAAIMATGNGNMFTAGTPVEINTSCTANFAPSTVMITVNISDKEK